eukprot:UN03872
MHRVENRTVPPPPPLQKSRPLNDLLLPLNLQKKQLHVFLCTVPTTKNQCSLKKRVIISGRPLVVLPSNLVRVWAAGFWSLEAPEILEKND